jgi:hypothetical protein
MEVPETICNPATQTAKNLVVRLLADGPEWQSLAPLQRQLSRNALVVDDCIALGLVEMRARRVGKRGGLRREVRLSPDGWRAYSEALV